MLLTSVSSEPVDPVAGIEQLQNEVDALQAAGALNDYDSMENQQSRIVNYHYVIKYCRIVCRFID